jgi:hypothetical protein
MNTLISAAIFAINATLAIQGIGEGNLVQALFGLFGVALITMHILKPQNVKKNS